MSADVEWLADTARRAQARHGDLLEVLAQMSGPLFALGRPQPPSAPEAQSAADKLDRLAEIAAQHLQALTEYVQAVTDPGQAYCRACGLPIRVPLEEGADRPWLHRLFLPDGTEWGETDHPADAAFEPATRPDWDEVGDDTQAGDPS